MYQHLSMNTSFILVILLANISSILTLSLARSLQTFHVLKGNLCSISIYIPYVSNLSILQDFFQGGNFSIWRSFCSVILFLLHWLLLSPLFFISWMLHSGKVFILPYHLLFILSVCAANKHIYYLQVLIKRSSLTFIYMTKDLILNLLFYALPDIQKYCFSSGCHSTVNFYFDSCEN